MKQSGWLLTLCVSCSLVLLASAQVTITNPTAGSPNPLYAEVGKPLTLRCDYSLTGGYVVETIVWYYNSGVETKIFKQSTWSESATPATSLKWYGDFHSADKPGESDKAEFLGSVTQANGLAGIKILSFQDGDAGAYKCEVDAESGANTDADRATINVAINIPPETPMVSFIVDDDAQTDQTKFGLIAGQKVEMTCTGNLGNPQGKLSWKRQVGDVWELVQGSSSTVDNTTNVETVVYTQTFTSGGMFKCVASRLAFSGVAAVDLSSAELPFTVKTPKPVADVNMVAKATDQETKQETGSYATGQSIALQCDVSSYPTADIVWEKDGAKVGDGFQLTLDDATPAQSGTYTCVATNYVNGRKYVGRQDVQVDIAENSNAGMIAGIVIAVIVVLGVIAGVLVYIFVFKRRAGGAGGKSGDEAEKGAELDGEQPKDAENATEEEKKNPHTESPI